MTTAPPLEGIIVVELGGVGPDPVACGILSDLGATIVRVERPTATPFAQGLSTIGVRDCVVVRLDAKADRDYRILRTLIAGADVLIEGFRPGVAERLGIGPGDVRESNPGLIYVRMTGWGQTGHRSSTAGHDINYIGVTGILAAIGEDQPIPPLNLVGDYGGGAMFAVVGALAALVDRSRTGRGRVIDVAMVDGAATLVAPIRDLLERGLWSERRASNLLDGGAPFYRTYRTSDGEAMAVGALEDPFYDAMVRNLGLDPDGLADRHDPANWPALTATFADTFATRTRREWTDIFDGTDACVTPVLTFTEAVDDRHSVERGSYVHTDAGARPAPAPRMSGTTERRMERSASDTLLALGCTEETIRALEEAGDVAIV